jgi:pimeloyl-ACP methyl ester carboxylesterase
LVSIDEQAKAFYELLKNYPDYEITVVGRSYGAAIAAKLAMDYPNLVKKLFLISPACAPKLENTGGSRNL